MIQYIYLVPLFPLLGFMINGLGWRTISKKVGGFIGCLSVFASFILSVVIFLEVKQGQSGIVHLYDFIQTVNLHIPFDFQVDALSSLFILIITGVGFLIHLYSTAYMHDDAGLVKYFAYLNLFVFSMLLLVLGSSYLILFIGWEGVGLCSYLLIGFWFKKKEYTKAANKAFIMNRIGDLGFIIGMLLVVFHFGTLNYAEFFSQLGTPSDPSSVSIKTWIAICFFIGAMGKSAQIPLYTWLPDAMAGPTPVSALIHAATMVTAGIYMIARSHALYSLTPIAQQLIVGIGLATALVAASIALFQNDIKKVLAYSTVSQLGFMFLAMGVGAYTTGVFHVMTHAFFKALLFLGAGSVIHALGGEQDIINMGGLRKKMPITFITCCIGVIAIAGVPFTSGFFSKDEILIALYQYNKAFFYMTVFAAILTAFYMFRFLFLVFFGDFRGTEEQAAHAHESPWAITFPLIILALLSLSAGWIQMPHIFGGHPYLNQFLSTVIPETNANEANSKLEINILIGTLIALIIIVATTFKLYAVSQFKGTYSGIKKVLADKWYFDELYQKIIIQPITHLAHFLESFIDNKVIDGSVNGSGKLVRWSSDKFRLLQTGLVGNYLFIMVISMVLLVTLGIFYQIFF